MVHVRAQRGAQERVDVHDRFKPWGRDLAPAPRNVSVNVADLYLPHRLSSRPALRGLEGALEQLFLDRSLRAKPPGSLQCHDLRPTRFGGGPYRAQNRTKAAQFHGFEFGRTIDDAIDGLKKTLIGVADDKFSVEAFARPLLWLRYGKSDVDEQHFVLYADDFGGLRAFVGEPPPPVD